MRELNLDRLRTLVTIADLGSFAEAARTLHLDSEIGSIECGKRADFCVLEDDPTAGDPQALRDVRVWGTVQGGRVFPAGR